MEMSFSPIPMITNKKLAHLTVFGCAFFTLCYIELVTEKCYTIFYANDVFDIIGGFYEHK